MECLSKASDRIPALAALERRMGVKKEYVLLTASIFFLLLILLTSLGPLITSVAGMLIPLQESLQLLKQVNPKKDETRQMLVFWVIFGMLSVLDIYSRGLVKIVPFFYALKFAFLLWIGPLKFRGALRVYDAVLVHVPETWYTDTRGIENAVKQASSAVKNMANGDLAKDVVEPASKEDLNGVKADKKAD
jgi:receptor expression-enhancing protein 5/6